MPITSATSWSSSWPIARQPGAVLRAGNDPVAAELASEDLDLGFEEADAVIAARGTGFKEEMQNDVEPANHCL